MASRVLSKAISPLLLSRRNVIGGATKYASMFDINLPKTETSTLGNSFRVASEDWKTHTCTVGIWVNAGSRSETDSNNGVAHFLEHMAFKGTDKRDQQALELEVENKGAHLNAYTSREMTVYYAKCFNDDLPWAVELLSDILKNSKFDSRLVERERGVILREMEEIESNYQEVIFDYLHATAYQGTSLGRTILGPVENIKSLSVNHMKDYIKNNYIAPRMVLCAAGEQHFGDLPASGVSSSVADYSRYTGSEIRDRDDALPLAHAAIAFEGPPWSNTETLNMMVASSIHGAWDRSFGGGSNVASKLASKFFQEDSVHSFQNFFTCYTDTSLWGVYLTAEKMGLETAVNEFSKEFVRLCTHIDDYEVERAKNQLKTHLLLQLDGTTPACEEIGRHMLVYGRRIPVAELLNRINEITVNQVRDTCSKYIFDKCPVVSALGPIECLPDYNRIRSQTWWLRL